MLWGSSCFEYGGCSCFHSKKSQILSSSQRRRDPCWPTTLEGVFSLRCFLGHLLCSDLFHKDSPLLRCMNMNRKLSDARRWHLVGLNYFISICLRNVSKAFVMLNPFTLNLLFKANQLNIDVKNIDMKNHMLLFHNFLWHDFFFIFKFMNGVGKKITFFQV